MKKIISIALMLTMIVSIFATSTSAASLLVQSDFSSTDAFISKFIAGAYYIEDNLLFGYSEAKALQTNEEWYVYDAYCEVALADDELSETDRFFSVVYPNTNLRNYGHMEETCYMSFSYDVANKQVYLTGGEFVGYDETDIIAGPISYDGIADDGSEFNSFGISVSRGRIRCFINDTLLIDFVDSADKYLIGLDDESTVPTKHVFWNDGNFIQYKDIKLSTPEYIYPTTPAVDTSTTAPVGGDNPVVTTAKATSETTTRKEIVDVTDDKGNAVTDNKGNKVTEEIIITEPPVADTNTGAPQGGNSTTTGDKAVMVVSAMVVALGCALIVKKVHD